MQTFEHAAADVAQAESSAQSSFYPLATIKCDGPAAFRSQTARDVACLLDVDPDVSAWSCQPKQWGHLPMVPDFLVCLEGGNRRYVDAPDREALGAAYRGELDAEYLQLSEAEVHDGYRLQNAKDLLRYGKWRTSLGDRVRLLAVLDEHGSLTLAECLGAFQETKPVAGIASLILSGFLEVDLDTALIGPETTVRRIRP